MEMTGLDELRPAEPVTGLALERVHPGSALIPVTLARIGAAYNWTSATRTEEEWAEWLSHPSRQYWLIKLGMETAGIVDLEPHPGEVEITTFGLLPEYLGQGLGGYALTLAVRQAWRVQPDGTGPARRVWLHTSSDDHPNAIPNYERRGFRVFQP